MQVLAQPGDLVLYVDGGCNNNGNRVGAYVFVCVKLDHFSLQSTFKHGLLVFGKGGRVNGTSNNIMEMQAVYVGLQTCKQKDVVPKAIITDSQYVQKGLTLWSQDWARNGWRGSTGKPVKNKELWQQLLSIWNREHTQIIHIRGHSGVFWNEFCDSQASQLIKYSKEVEIQEVRDETNKLQ